MDVFLSNRRIRKIDLETSRVLATMPSPVRGRDSGLAWAEGTLWVGQYRDRKIYSGRHAVPPFTVSLDNPEPASRNCAVRSRKKDLRSAGTGGMSCSHEDHPEQPVAVSQSASRNREL